MNTKEVLNQMSKGATLCMEFCAEEKVFWLEPRRAIIRRDIAEALLNVPGIVPGNDSLLDDGICQTWKMVK